MSDAEERVGGVTLTLASSSVAGKTAEGKQRITVTLKCEATADEWNALEARFRKGFRVYLSADFHEQVLALMREELQGHEKEYRVLQLQLRVEKEQHEATAEEMQQLKALFGALGKYLT